MDQPLLFPAHPLPTPLLFTIADPPMVTRPGEVALREPSIPRGVPLIGGAEEDFGS